MNNVADNAGAGAIAIPFTLLNSSLGGPIECADVWVTSDASGDNVVASGRTGQDGKFTFFLDPGPYVFWAKKPGFWFTTPLKTMVT